MKKNMKMKAMLAAIFISGNMASKIGSQENNFENKSARRNLLHMHL
jgi:hypothetical protein